MITRQASISENASFRSIREESLMSDSCDLKFSEESEYLATANKLPRINQINNNPVTNASNMDKKLDRR